MADDTSTPASSGIHPLAAQGVGQMASIIVVWALNTFAHLAVPTEVGMAVGGLVGVLAHVYWGAQ